ncbi:MAG: leucine--tRNA ligase [Candidatus Eisenbacteria bacterium]|nr:leucine--tRNA ligase [Candidatus Eisenbacteria bacterium]
MKPYPFSTIEPKWQKRWEESRLFECPTDAENRFYCLVMYPYPSGDLHVGHGRNYIIGDAVARHAMMRGRSVLSPMGWDAFGLPAENAAIERGIHPPVWTDRNIRKMKSQFRAWGIGYDWSREFASHEPSFYRWTQWLFVKLFERGLAYRKSAPVNWCPSCATVLANEQVVGGRCERCDAQVTTTDLEQWFFRITDYADRLLSGLDSLESWPERVKTMQRNWIGRSEGVEIDFRVAETDEPLSCFTTRVDTIFGVTYIVMAAEHPMLRDLVAGTEQEREVLEFAERVRAQDQFDRSAADVFKQGVATGRHVVNPVNGEKIPIWVANYVLMEYGTGAVMAVPAHDQRDFEFARKYGLPLRVVIESPDEGLSGGELDSAYVEDGVQVNSGQFDGVPNREAMERIADWMEEEGTGRRTVSYRLRDWLVSRQRYWGTPIPVVYCERCGVRAVPEEELPVLLPTDVEFTGKGESPLTTSKTFRRAVCPECGGEARRETDTLDTFVDSSWYLFRYISPRDESAPFVREDVDRWFPVDLYIGGVEHACGHLIFVRFMTKVLHDLGLLGFDEPIDTLFSQGMITLDGAKMSKSKGNAVPPDELIGEYGADTERLYTLFAGPPDRDAEWNDTAVEGAFRFLNRVWHTVEKWPFRAGERERLSDELSGDGPPDNVRDLHRKTHQTIRKVSADMAAMHFNTAVASLMELSNALRAFTEAFQAEGGKVREPSGVERKAVAEALESLVLLLAPMVPHFCEELWERAGGGGSVFEVSWPDYDEESAREDFVTIAVQVNGKLRGEVEAERGAMEDVVVELAHANEKISNHIEGKEVRRVIYVQDRLLNFVVG